MRNRLLVAVVFAGTASLTLSLIRGQERPTTPAKSTPATPTAPLPAVLTGAQPASTGLSPLRDLSRFTKLQQQMFFTAQRGADWLFRMHGVKGRFLAGYVPALKQPLEQQNYLHQAGAASALARAARFAGEDRFAARATQAILALLEDTATDPEDTLSRCTTLPPAILNRVASSGALLLAIHELPSPQKDLLDRGEELARYISRQVNENGSFKGIDPDAKGHHNDSSAYASLALAGLARSHRLRPANWKMDLVRKAVPVYRTGWKAARHRDCVPALTQACTEAYLQGRDKAMAEFVFEMNDWLCSLQYAQIDPRRMYWYGGFMDYKDGRTIENPPHVNSAALIESLVEACRVAREVGDVERHQRYSEAIERGLQFLMTLQYTDAVSQHFAVWFRPQIVGAFHASTQDGNLHIEYTQHAVGAFLGYLEHVVR